MEILIQGSVNNYENEQSSMEVHSIGGYPTTVGVADYEHQGNQLDTTMDTSMVTETRLSDLNDQCLETIFSLKFISITDLCAVARTNHRFMNIANRQFRLNHKTCNIRSLVSRIYDAKRVIVTFGFLISDLWIGEDYDSNVNWTIQWTFEDWTNLLILVIRSCSKTLDNLQIELCFIPKYLTNGLKKLFRNLQKLSINDCQFQSCGNLFAGCKKLVELTFSGMNLDDATQEALNVRFVMDNVFPKLERFRYEGGDCENLAIFLSRHKNLKSLNILECEYSFFLLPIIAINCIHLEELAVDFPLLSDEARDEGGNGNVVESLQMLEHLRTLKIYCPGKNITEFIPKLNLLKSLEFLELCGATADSEFISAVSQLKRLQVLRLIFCKSRGKSLVNLNRLADLNKLIKLSIRTNENICLDIVLLVKRSNSLKTLNIWAETYELDKKMYLDLVTVVRNRPTRSQQSLQIGCYIAEDAVADLQNDRDNRQIVKLKIAVKDVKL